jgi:hypothetical protein
VRVLPASLFLIDMIFWNFVSLNVRSFHYAGSTLAFCVHLFLLARPCVSLSLCTLIAGR